MNRGRRQRREAEVQDLYPPVGRDEDVLRLEVAVDDSFVVRRSQTAGDLDRDLHSLARRRRVGGETLAEGFALEQFGDGVDDRRAWRQRVRADVVDGEDVRVRERGDSLRFALEALAACRVVGELRRQDLDRDSAIEAPVQRPIDFPHSPGPERRDDFIRPEPSTGCERHREWLGL